MSEVAISLEWERVQGSRGDVLAATWARLSIRVGDSVITEVYDDRAHSVRRHVLIPAYPIAEWIASHWWVLFYEAEKAPARDDYEQRHNLRLGREGFALPDLLIKPTGERVLIEWRPTGLAEARLRFPGGGSQIVELAAVREAFVDLVETVLARLDSEGVMDTFLHGEWQAIQAADDDEADFCAAAARLGQDPYALTEPQTQAILAAAEALPPQWHDTFFGGADIARIGDQLALLRQERVKLHGASVSLPAIVPLRRDSEKIDPTRAPWEQGYQVARRLRARLGVDDQPLGDDAALAAALGITSAANLYLGAPAAPARWLDALVESDEDDCPAFLTTKPRPEAARFAFCRALFEYLTLPAAPSALLTTAKTDRQKRNRAFAAEFLAPAAWLRGRLSGPCAGPDEIDEWADRLGVSTEVVRFQLVNHRLAEVVGL